MRAQLLGVLNAPASKLVRTIAEPARGLAAVVNAYAKKESGEARLPSKFRETRVSRRKPISSIYGSQETADRPNQGSLLQWLI